MKVGEVCGRLMVAARYWAAQRHNRYREAA